MSRGAQQGVLPLPAQSRVRLTIDADAANIKLLRILPPERRLPFIEDWVDALLTDPNTHFECAKLTPEGR